MKKRIPQIALGVLTGVIFFAVSAFLFRPANVHYNFSAYQLETDSNLGAGKSFHWTLDVKGVEKADQRVKLPKGESLQVVISEFGTVHEGAGGMVSRWLSLNTLDEVCAKLEAATGRVIPAETVLGAVEVSFLAAGWQKRVYRIKFPLKSGEPAVMVLKIPKGEPSSFERELEHQALLNKNGFPVVPRLVDVVKSGSDFFYFEEFIIGNKLTELRKQNAVSREIARSIIRHLLIIYRETGNLPKGIRPKQIFIRDAERGGKEAVLIDLGGQGLTQPFEIVDQLDMWYGIEGRGMNARSAPFGAFSQWGFLMKRGRGQPAVRDTLIFDEIYNVFGPERGKLILQEAFTELNRRPVSKFRFTHDDFEPFFRGENRLDRYMNLMARKVRGAVSQWDRRVEYQHLKLDLAAAVK